jgi:hypothetical protein
MIITKRRAIALVTFLAAIVVAWFVGPGSSGPEPQFEGVPITHWLARYCLAYGRTGSETPASQRAFREMKLPARDWLLRFIDQPDNSARIAKVQKAIRERASPRQLSLASIVDRLLGRNQPAFEKPETIRHCAMAALIDQKPDPDTLFPLLTPYFASPDPAVRGRALWVIGSTGRGTTLGLSHLLAGLQDPDERNRIIAAQGAGAIVVAYRDTVPAMLRAYAQTSVTHRHAMAWAYVDAATPAPEKLPLLLQMLAGAGGNADPIAIAKAICDVDPGNVAGLKVLVQTASTEDRWQVLGRLAASSRPPKLPRDYLTSILKSHDLPPFRLEQLRLVGFSNDILINELETICRTDANNAERLYFATRLLLQLSPGNRVALTALLEGIKSPPPNATDYTSIANALVSDFAPWSTLRNSGQPSLICLAFQGTNAAWVIPDLEELRTHPAHQGISNAIQTTIDLIRNPPPIESMIILMTDASSGK